jgi:hypothetical protein
MKYLGVMVAGFVLGGWAVPLGFVLGLGPVATFVAAAGGGLLGCWAFLLAGDQISAVMRRHRRADTSGSAADDENEPPAEEPSDEADDTDVGRVSRFVDRYGVRGLGLVGPIFPGVTASVAGGLALGLDRRSLGKWMTIGIIVMYGLYVLGLSLLVWLF